MAPSISAAASSPALLFSVRDIAGDLENAKASFSSWDGCMSKVYCKWPVIVGIIIASVIVLSILFCLFRCLCCGLECCCGICSCCNACCPSPRRKQRNQYQQAPQGPWTGYGPPPPGPMPWQPSPYAQPQPQEPMMYGARGAGTPAPGFAQFDDPTKKLGATATNRMANGDTLPAMPSWDTAQTRKVEDTSIQDDEPLEESTAHGEQGIPLEEQRQPMLAASQPQAHSSPYDDDYSPTGHYDTRTQTGYGAPAPLNAQSMPYNRQQAPTRTGPSSPTGYSPSTTAYGPSTLHERQHIGPSSPVASSTYSTVAPPSYHTNANAQQPQSFGVQNRSPPPAQFQPYAQRTTSPRPPVQTQPYAPQTRSPPPQQSYTSYSPPPPQQQYSAFSPPPQEPSPPQQGAYTSYRPYNGAGSGGI